MRQFPTSKLFLFIMIVILFTSCSTAKGPLFVQETISADADPTLYIYRPSSSLLYVAKWEFVIDEDIVANLSNGTYAKLPIKPGKHEIISAGSPNIEQPPLRICFEAVKGKNTYIKYEMRTKHGYIMSLLDRPKFNNILSEVEEGQALAELKEIHATTLPQRKY